MVTSYKQLIKFVDDFASQHQQIQRFRAEFEEQMPNFATENEAYPILFMAPVGSQFFFNQDTYTVRFYCFDIIQKDRANINYILSDTNLILNDLKKWFQDGTNYTFDILGDPTATPINNALLDYAAGWQMDITFNVDTYCVDEIPFKDSPLIPVEGYDVVYSRYLTCETVTGCTSLQDYVQNEIENFTGFTSEDTYWISGSTGLFSVKAKNDSGLDAVNDYSLAEGFATRAQGYSSHAEGQFTTAGGQASHAEGDTTRASGQASHAEGFETSASGSYSHTEGSNTTALGSSSHAEGEGTIAAVRRAHAEGLQTTASGDTSHAEGIQTVTNGTAAHAEGAGSIADGDYSHAEGESTLASATASHVEGFKTTAEGEYSHAEGKATYTKGSAAHAEGENTVAQGIRSHAEGNTTLANADDSHAEGNNTTADGTYSHAEGLFTTTESSADGGHAEGAYSISSGRRSHAEGLQTLAKGNQSHAEGYLTTSGGEASHAEGYETTAGGFAAHSQGQQTIAFGDNSFASGKNTQASGAISLVHGLNSRALSATTIVLGNNITGTSENTVYVPNIQFDLNAPSTMEVGRMEWNDADGTVDLRLKGNNVTLQIGQEQVVRVVNKTGANLLESQYRAVRVRNVSEGGAQGQRLAVVLAQANTTISALDTIGLVTENIDNNQEGFITLLGQVRNINTTGSLQGETWVDGDVLYLSPTNAGGLTKVKPIAPNKTIVIGYVEYAHVNNGKIYVNIQNGYDLDDLNDVSITGSTTNGQWLEYDSSLSAWTNTSAFDFSLNFISDFTYPIILPYNWLVESVDNPSAIGVNLSATTGTYTLNTNISAFTETLTVSAATSGFINLNCRRIN
jgi:hypothetical protein